MTFLMFVFAFAYSATAGGIISTNGCFTTGTSFENQPTGEFKPTWDDSGSNTGTNYWNNEATTGAVVAAYSARNPAYDYAAHGTTRSPFLATQEPDVAKYLATDLDAPLERLIMPHLTSGTISNTYTKTAAYDGIYADTLIKLSPSIAGPKVDDADRIIVWMQETEDGGTNLVVTAGSYGGDYGTVTAANYRVVSPTVSADTWCRMTIRAISDVTEYQGGKGIAKRAPGFTIYFDGQPAEILAIDYAQAGFSRVENSILSAEARVLIDKRQLLPGLTKAASNGSVVLSRLSFGGRGAVDDVMFSTERPDCAVQSGYSLTENVFTLNWDAGIVGYIRGTVSNSCGIVPFDIDTAAMRYCDFALGTNNYALVAVTNVCYDYENDYSNGVWAAANDCTVADNRAFVYDGMSKNPIGYVLSSRRVIGVGDDAAGGCSTSFAEAKALAKKNGIKKIVLETDMVIANMTKAQAQAAGLLYYDQGSFEIFSGDDFILDLNGHVLRGSGKDPTVSQSGGKLRITDSSKASATGMTGRIFPSTRASKNRIQVAVKSYATSSETPELILDAGWFEGLVAVTGDVITAQFGSPTNYTAACIVEGGNYTNSYAGARHFYLEQFVTNPAAYFGLTGDYWTTTTNGFIWCGKGADHRWTNKDNWKGGAVPGAGDLAIFPLPETGAAEWPVDFGDAGVQTTTLLMDADIAMSGTNDFTHVKILPSAGRINGSGLVKFTGRLPGMLTDVKRTDGEIRLGEGWSGTVRISNVHSANELASILGWGNSRSKVEFNGVRGYLFSRKQSYALPYGLILTDYVYDGGTNAAWKNEMGYTGSTVSFPTLSGSGTFLSSKVRTASAQLFVFRNVERFTGKFSFSDKRLLLGKGSTAAQSKPGDFTFSNGLGVRSGLGWEGVNAHFGTNLVVYGQLKQELMSYDKKESPSVRAVAVTLIDPATGETNTTCRLFAADGRITVESLDTVDYAGKAVAAEDVGGSVKAGSTFEVPPGSAVTIKDNMVIVNGAIVSTFAEYYKVMSVDGTTYSVQFDEEAATPTLADVTLVPGENGTSANVRVNNVKDDLWYGLQTLSSLAADWDAATTEWKQATGDTVTFETDATGGASFFRVIMTDQEPDGGGK